MVSVSEASSIILSHLYRSKPERVPLDESLGRILAEEIVADRDFPPFDRVAMDGIALQFGQLDKGKTKFDVEGVGAAGQPQLQLVNAANCIEIMTGAPLPANTDTVIPYEEVSISNKKATLTSTKHEKGQHIHPQGKDARAGATLLQPGLQISPAEIALMASVGKQEVSVWQLPRFVVISTGDELVEVDQQPLPHQIRRSNNHALVAALSQLGCTAKSMLIRDVETETDLQRLRSVLSDEDVLIFSGGVSKGKFDFVPNILDRLGVQKLFHKVSQKPGKPFWFGATSDKTVFALPGNPVSTFLCFHRYVIPWLKTSLGVTPPSEFAILSKDFTTNTELTYFLQAHIENKEGRLEALPIAGGGSGDFANLKDVDGFLELPPTKGKHKAGDVFPFYRFRSL